MINGHDHDYERFGPQDPEGHLDNTRGIREFVAGTGGKNSHRIFAQPVANSEVRNADSFGVVKLNLQQLRLGVYSRSREDIQGFWQWRLPLEFMNRPFIRERISGRLPIKPTAAKPSIQKEKGCSEFRNSLDTRVS